MTDESYALGVIVNPKLKVPVLVMTDGSYVEIRQMAESYPVIGTGYYGMDDEVARTTGLPRSHTPDGVAIEGHGYGTCLYTALCLGAHQNHLSHEGEGWRYRISGYGPDGDGICSTSSDRSSDADDWWSRAKRLGLAREMQDDQEDEDVDVTSDFDSLIEGQEYGDGTISRVTTITADVSKTVFSDIYFYESAHRHKLVVADFSLIPPSPEALWRAVVDTTLPVDASLELILALDVRGLDVSAMNLLGLLAERGGADEETLHDLRFRWESGLDPGVPVRQMRLPFKKNSSEARRARAVLEETAHYRSRAGWAELESLP